MDGDKIVLAYTAEDSNYAVELARDLPNLKINIVPAEDDFAALRGRKLFQYLNDLADKEELYEIILLLPYRFTVNQANSYRLTVEQYIFYVYLNESDPLGSPPGILCLKKPTTIKAKQDPVRASSNPTPYDQTESSDKFNISQRPVASIPSSSPRKQEKPIDKSKKKNNAKRLATVLQGYEEALRLGYANPTDYIGMGNALWCLERYYDAYNAYQQSIRYVPDNASAYNGLGNTLWCLERYDEALRAYEEATRLRQSGEKNI